MHICTRNILVLFVSLVTYTLCYAQQPYRTQILRDDIATLQVQRFGDFMAPPIIELIDDKTIEISFDLLAIDTQYFSYSLIHCNANWQPSGLSELEFLDGFNTQSVEYSAPSYNTYTQYVHYAIMLPNDKVRFRVSGNYALVVFPENQPESPVLQACFSVSENRVSVLSNVTTLTDIDSNKGHQQVEFNILYPSYPIQDPQELSISVSQNNRRDNEVFVKQPLYRKINELVYQHNRDLIFAAGNEYRRFEMVNVRYAGLGVQSIRFFDPYYHVTLFPAYPRNNQNYQFDETQYGRFFIRQSDAADSNLEADYFIVHFTLDYDNPLVQGNIYLNGYLTYDLFNDKSHMTYNFEKKAFEKDMLLKQGSYNYQYLYLPLGETKGNTEFIEGNFSDTINEYLIKVYHRNPGERYDRFIGYSRCLSNE